MPGNCFDAWNLEQRVAKLETERARLRAMITNVCIGVGADALTDLLMRWLTA